MYVQIIIWLYILCTSTWDIDIIILGLYRFFFCSSSVIYVRFSCSMLFYFFYFVPVCLYGWIFVMMMMMMTDDDDWWQLINSVAWNRVGKKGSVVYFLFIGYRKEVISFHSHHTTPHHIIDWSWPFSCFVFSLFPFYASSFFSSTTTSSTWVVLFFKYFMTYSSREGCWSCGRLKGVQTGSPINKRIAWIKSVVSHVKRW